MKEEILTIIKKYKFIDLKELKQKIPKLCLRVITKMMTESLTNQKSTTSDKEKKS
jgi:hypothetical protein